MSHNREIVNSGFCYDIHEASPHGIECLASWQSLIQGVICVLGFVHLMSKVNSNNKRALTGFTKNIISIDTHQRSFYLLILFYILWGIGSVFDINKDYKYAKFDSPGLAGNDINLLFPLILGASSCRGLSNFLEIYTAFLLLSEDAGASSKRFFLIISLMSTIIYVPAIIIVIIYAPGQYVISEDGLSYAMAICVCHGYHISR